MSSGELEKYEYLTGEDLAYEPGIIKQTKLEYSTLSKVFYRGLRKEDKKEGLLKELENVESTKEKQLRSIKEHGEKLSKMFIDQIKSRKLALKGGIN